MKHVVALLPVLIAFQAGAPPALAWTWPADGPVLRPFVLGNDPYAAAQHRGVDIASPSGAPVRAPAAGVVTFAGTVPGGGRTVTIQTADGYSVTLVHLGAIAVEREQQVAEGAGVGSAGGSGRPEHAEAYVHLGVRVTADPNGYVDPLVLLPGRDVPPPAAPEPPAQAPEAPVAPPPVPEAPAVPAPAPQTPAPESGPPEPVPAAAAPRPVPGTVPAIAGVAGPAAAADERVEAAESARPRAAQPTTGARMERTLERAFELPSPRVWNARPAAHGGQASPSAGRAGPGHGLVLGGAVAVLGGAGLLGLALIRRRGDLGGAGAADAAAPVLRHGAGRAAEDTAVARTTEEDRLVADRDLERVALGEPEPLADLDRDHDPPQLVQVPDDPRCGLPATAARRRFHQVISRPPRHRRRPARPAARPIR